MARSTPSNSVRVFTNSGQAERAARTCEATFGGTWEHFRMVRPTGNVVWIVRRARK